MLIFPPEWVPTAPYLALPSLTAVLRDAGHTVIQRDINIGMWDHFFSMEFLIWMKARLGMQLKNLQEKEKAGLLTEREVSHMAVVEQAYDLDVFDLADRAEDAKLIVRGERFYEAETLPDYQPQDGKEKSTSSRSSVGTLHALLVVHGCQRAGV